MSEAMVAQCSAPASDPANSAFLRLRPIPVHSAHAGDEVDVHYRWHPYFGQKVSVRRVEERATGRFVKVLGPTGVVIAISGWMIDPVVCSGIPI
ncbi:hypothetical protein ACC702_23780 [Rhizobium ruizarguesonis]